MSEVQQAPDFMMDPIILDGNESDQEYKSGACPDAQTSNKCAACGTMKDLHIWEVGCKEDDCKVHNHRPCMINDLNDCSKMYCRIHFDKKYESIYQENAIDLEVIRIFKDRVGDGYMEWYYFKYIVEFNHTEIIELNQDIMLGQVLNY